MAMAVESGNWKRKIKKEIGKEYVRKNDNVKN
jgi:hypothetical protein